MLERLILKVELDVVLFRALTNGNVKEDFNSALGDGTMLVRLREFDVVPGREIKLGQDERLYLLKHIAVFLTKEDLVDVDFGPSVDVFLHDSFSLFFSHN